MPPAYAPSYRYQDGIQSAYSAGLTYFPDTPMYAPMPMGDWTTDLAMVGGGAVGGPAGASAAGAIASVAQRWFGGSAVDQQRQERVNYVAQKAVNGNVAAMRLILAGPDNVSGNERQMWLTAHDLIQRANPDVVRAAEAIGPDWLPNSGDTATNYPRMRSYIAAWDAQNPIAAVTGSVGSAISNFLNPTPPAQQYGLPAGGVGQPIVRPSAGVSPTLLLGGAALVAVLALSGKRRRS